MKRRILRKVLGFLSCSTAVFVFEACYGMPRNIHYNYISIKGRILDKATALPVKGIEVAGISDSRDTTDVDGKFSVIAEEKVKTEKIYPLSLTIKDIDSVVNGLYKNIDTTFVSVFKEEELIIYLEKE